MTWKFDLWCIDMSNYVLFTAFQIKLKKILNSSCQCFLLNLISDKSTNLQYFLGKKMCQHCELQREKKVQRHKSFFNILGTILKGQSFPFSFFSFLFKVIIFFLILITINLAQLDNLHQPIQQQMKITFLKCIQFLTIAKRKRKNDTSLGFRKFAS